MRTSLYITTVSLFFSISLICQAQHLYRANEFIVTYHETAVDHKNILARNPDLIQIDQIFRNPDIYLYTYRPEAEIELANVKSLRHLKSVESNILLETRINIPDDPLYPEMWHLPQIQAAEAWDIHTGGTNAFGDTIVIGIFDSGYQLDHPDLNSSFWRNKSEIPNDLIDNDGNGYVDDHIGLNLSTGDDQHKSSLHGTLVAGVAGPMGNNDIGICSVNWDSRLMVLSMSNDAPAESDFIRALDYFRRMRQKYNESNGKEGAYVVTVNTSLGISGVYPEDFPVWCEIYEALGSEGITSVVATANEQIDIDIEGDMPTNCPSPYLLGVTGSDQSDQVLRSTAYGKINVDLAAPGRQIYSTVPGSGYSNSYTGTSLAAPMVSSSIALLHAAASSDLSTILRDSPAQGVLILRDLLLSQVDKNNGLQDKVSSGGRLNLYRAVLAAKNYTTEHANSLAIQSVYPADRSYFLEIDLISSNTDPIHFNIYDISGQLIKDRIQESGFSSGRNRIYLDIGPLSNGFYLLEARQLNFTSTKGFVFVRN
jgi:subtilisin family serine protease